jgi:hypothetical protein
LDDHQRSSSVQRVDRTGLRCWEPAIAAGHGHPDDYCQRNDSHLSLHVHHLSVTRTRSRCLAYRHRTIYR